MQQFRKKGLCFGLSALISVFLSGCMESQVDKVAQKEGLDPCTKEAGVLPQPEYDFKGVRFEELYSQRAVDACRQRLADHPDDATAKALLARALTKQKKYDEAFALLESSCDAGDDAGCTLLGSYYVDGLKKRTIDRKHGEELYEQSCSHGYAPACLNLGKIYLNGNGVDKDPVKGERLIYMACENGYTVACRHYSNAARFQQLIAEEDRLLFAAKKTCEAGLDCTYWRMIAKQEDNVTNAEVAEKACQNGLADACEELANFHMEGRGVNVDKEKSLALYKKACEAGRVRFACWYAGLMLYHDGIDKKEGTRLIDSACHRGENRFACGDLDEIYKKEPSLVPEKSGSDSYIRIELP